MMPYITPSSLVPVPPLSSSSSPYYYYYYYYQYHRREKDVARLSQTPPDQILGCSEDVLLEQLPHWTQGKMGLGGGGGMVEVVVITTVNESEEGDQIIIKSHQKGYG